MFHLYGRNILIAAAVILVASGGWQYWKERQLRQSGVPSTMTEGFNGQWAMPQPGPAPASNAPRATGPYAPPPGQPLPRGGGQFQPPASTPTAQGTGGLYRDPSGRFSINVPGGWRAASQNGGVLVTRGNATAVISPFGGAYSGDQIVSTLGQQYASQWTNLQLIDQGQFMLAGAPAAYVMLSGTSPRGVPSLLRIAGVVRGNEGYAVIITAPLTEFQNASGSLQSIEASLSFGGQQGGGY